MKINLKHIDWNALYNTPNVFIVILSMSATVSLIVLAGILMTSFIAWAPPTAMGWRILLVLTILPVLTYIVAPKIEENMS